MVTLSISIFLLILAIIFPLLSSHFDSPGRFIIRLLLVFGALAIFSTLHFVIVGQDQVGHLKRVYFADPLPSGKIVAQSGQLGPQAKILSPGLNIQPFIKLFYEIEMKPVREVPEHYYGFLVAKDGLPLRDKQFLAERWPDLRKMIDAEYFLGEGQGQKGPQLTVLKPGKYRFNQYLFELKTGPQQGIIKQPYQAVEIPAGFVGVVKSAIQERPKEECQPIENEKTKHLDILVVPEYCRGVWESVLKPGTYYLNHRAYEVILVDTRVQRAEYKGGYKKRTIDLLLSDDGTIQQSISTENIPVPDRAADRAVMLKVEGWTIAQELRVLYQITSENAPYVVAFIGDLDKVESAIVTANVRSVVRNVAATDDPDAINVIFSEKEPSSLESVRKVLDLQDKRPLLEQKTLEALQKKLTPMGVIVREVLFGDPGIPPELLVARKREQLSEQMINTYKREQEAQKERIETMKSRATADQQPELVKAEIEVKVAEQKKIAAKLRGEGKKLELMEIAKGQEAQALVLGKDLTYKLESLKLVLQFIADNPTAVKMPVVLVQGNGSSLEGAAAIIAPFLGHSNISEGLFKLMEEKITEEMQ